jgi:hypothetical protein
MYPFNLVNCVTNNSNEYVSQFWKFYRGAGLPRGRPRILMIKFNTRTTEEYLRFKDLQSICPNINVSFMRQPRNLIPLEDGLLVSSGFYLYLFPEVVEKKKFK